MRIDYVLPSFGNVSVLVQVVQVMLTTARVPWGIECPRLHPADQAGVKRGPHTHLHRLNQGRFKTFPEAVN